MIYPEELVCLFKKHGFWRTTLLVFIVMCATIVMAIVFANVAALINAMWCAAVIFGNYIICMEKEAHEATKGKLADTRDQFCISKHEVERLTLELETAQSALVEAKRLEKTYVGFAQTGVVQVESSATASAIETDPIEASKPKTKRRPASKRKPKTEKTKNENQN